jgi:hypothetical protein
MVHEAFTEKIVLRALYRADHGDLPEISETHNATNAKKVNEAEQKPPWSKSITQRRLRWLLKQPLAWILRNFGCWQINFFRCSVADCRPPIEVR